MSDTERSSPTVATVSEFLGFVNEIHQECAVPRCWFRGHGDASWQLEPTVMRPDFRNRVKSETNASVDDDLLDYSCLLREIDMNRIFRIESAKLIQSQTDLVQLYFMARHHSLPTRLLDWTTNPLIALFFAVTEEKQLDGEVIVARPQTDFSALFGSLDGERTSLHPEESFSDQRSRTFRLVPDYLFGDKELPLSDLNQGDLMQVISDDIIGALNRLTASSNFERPVILPITPDSKIARVSQQNSKFTFHMPRAHSIDKQRLKRCAVPLDRKKSLQNELRMLGVRWDTVLDGLDYVCKEICEMRLA